MKKLIEPEVLTDPRITSPPADVHIRDIPIQAWKIAKGAATIQGVSIALWVALAILEKWDREKRNRL